MNKKSFGLDIKMLTSNFSLREPDPKNKEEMEAWRKRLKLIFTILEYKGFTDQDLNKATMGIISNEISLFGNLPPIVMFLKYAGKQKLEPEKQAQREAEHIIGYAKSYPSGQVIFDNVVTNAVARDYGIGYIRNQLTNNWLDYKKGDATIRKELIEKWLVYFYDRKESSQSIKIDNSNRLEMIGDKDKCRQLLNGKMIEQTNKTNKQQEINLLIGNLFKNGQK